MTRSEHPVGLPWRRLSAELVVIALGVFLGLAADAAWDARQDNATEIDYLRQLDADLIATAVNLDRAIPMQAGYDRAAGLALDGINSDPMPSPDSLLSWIWTGSTRARFEPTMGTITGLVQTGDLRLVSDRRLREGLMRYQQQVESITNTFNRYDEYRLRAIEQLGLVIGLDALPASYSPAQPLVPPDWPSAIQDPVFRSAVFNLRLTAEFRSRVLGQYQQRHDELREALNRALLAKGLDPAAP